MVGDYLRMKKAASSGKFSPVSPPGKMEELERKCRQQEAAIEELQGLLREEREAAVDAIGTSPPRGGPVKVCDTIVHH